MCYEINLPKTLWHKTITVLAFPMILICRESISRVAGQMCFRVSHEALVKEEQLVAGQPSLSVASSQGTFWTSLQQGDLKAVELLTLSSELQSNHFSEQDGS